MATTTDIVLSGGTGIALVFYSYFFIVMCLYAIYVFKNNN